jgi:hypothetical protein
MAANQDDTIAEVDLIEEFGISDTSKTRATNEYLTSHRKRVLFLACACILGKKCTVLPSRASKSHFIILRLQCISYVPYQLPRRSVPRGHRVAFRHGCLPAAKQCPAPSVAYYACRKRVMRAVRRQKPHQAENGTSRH